MTFERPRPGAHTTRHERMLCGRLARRGGRSGRSRPALHVGRSCAAVVVTPSHQVRHDGRVSVSLRVAHAADGPFLLDMLVEAAYWRPDRPRGDGQDVLADPELAHYVSGWPQPGDLGVVAEDEEPVGAAWLRFFSRESPGYGFVDDHTPELSMGVRVDRRGRGIGSRLLADLLARARAA